MISGVGLLHLLNLPTQSSVKHVLIPPAPFSGKHVLIPPAPFSAVAKKGGDYGLQVAVDQFDEYN